jgi:murein DD-endopeptidase MepM/ murein hydrolase activator NlpD
VIRAARRWRIVVLVLSTMGPVPLLVLFAFVALVGAMGGGEGAPAAGPEPVAAATPDPVAVAPGSLAWPLHGAISQPFGCTGVSLEPPRGNCTHFHTGIDIAAPIGTPVAAACAGTVALAVDSSYGFGNHVVVACSSVGVSTLYEHLSSRAVSTGDTVTAGQLIGDVGTTGNSSGPHLHFETDAAGGPVDPMGFLPPTR